MLMTKLGKSNKTSQLFLFFQNMFIIGIIKSQFYVLDHLNESILGWEKSEKRGRNGDKKCHEKASCYAASSLFTV